MRPPSYVIGFVAAAARFVKCGDCIVSAVGIFLKPRMARFHSIFWESIICRLVLVGLLLFCASPSGICRSFSDGTSVSNVYSRLDLFGRKDRMGNWSYLEHDSLDHLVSIENANGAFTTLGWCDCGALTTVIDALNQTNSLTYDLQSHVTGVTFADGSTVTYDLDALGRPTNIIDNTGRSVQLTFNLQNLLTCASNANGILRQVTYDLYDRPATVTDANGVTVSYTYDKLGRPVARTWPDSHGETYGWSTNGLAAFTNRDGKVTRYVHEAAGRTIAETNANLEVTGIGYDPAGHTISLINGLGKTNGWAYDVYGRCLAKRDANGNLVFTNAYNANGWVMTNWTPAGGFTSYKRDAVGNVTNIDYTNASIATPTVSMAYDALNQLTNLIDGIGTTRYTYTAIGQLASEVGPWPTNGINYTYNQGHRTSMSITSVVSTLDFTYGYDLGWRMESVTSPAGAIGYIYPNSASALVAGIALPNGASIANNYDSLGRLTGTALLNHWGHVLDGYTYTPDLLGLRTNILRNLGLTTNSVAVGYDNIGQMTVWNAVEGTAGTSRMNEQNWFGYDAGDNLTGRTEGGLGLEQTFTVDALNQLTNVAHIGGKLTVTGSIPAPAASVTVDGVAAQLYGDLTFAGTNNSYTLTNGWNTFTNIAQNAYGLKVTNLLTVNVPVNTPIHYDANGNLISDGLRAFTFDAADRMTNVYVTNQWKEEFAYDGLSRRRILRQYTWSSGNWLRTNEVRFVCDGLQIVQERGTDNIPQVTYTHGLDLSGTLGGAGGIGGLLARTDATNGSTFYHSDGAGNVTALMDMYENIVARYFYGPFGKLLGQWGRLGNANTMRAFSMPGDSIAGIVGFSFRFYDPNLQRWSNRDPIGENGGINLYGFVGNSPLNSVDPYGLADYYYSGGGILQPSGPVPYVEADSSLGTIAASIYNVAPVAANGLYNAYGSVVQALSAVGAAFNDLEQLAVDAGVNRGDIDSFNMIWAMEILPSSNPAPACNATEDNILSKLRFGTASPDALAEFNPITAEISYNRDNIRAAAEANGNTWQQELYISAYHEQGHAMLNGINNAVQSVLDLPQQPYFQWAWWQAAEETVVELYGQVAGRIHAWW